MHCLGKSTQKLKAVHSVNYISGFLGKKIKIALPVNYSVKKLFKKAVFKLFLRWYQTSNFIFKGTSVFASDFLGLSFCCNFASYRPICQITVNFGTLKDGSLSLIFLHQTNVLATETYSKLASTLCKK